MVQVYPFAFIIILLLTACQPPQDVMNHIGCQEGEINENGNCIVAEITNRDLFGQDFSASVTTEDIANGLHGFIARPTTPGTYPGIIMIHEWWGLNENIKDMASILANEGYVVFAIDLYEGKVATDSTTARELATNVRENPNHAITNMKNAVNYLKEAYSVPSIGSLGWCFGGQQSLQLSLNDKLDATVIYYGHLTTEKEELEKINGPVLGIFGEEDTSIPVSSVTTFESTLNELGVTNNVYIYSGVGHAFANPSGSDYAKEETLDAWDKTVSFLDRYLKE